MPARLVLPLAFVALALVTACRAPAPPPPSTDAATQRTLPSGDVAGFVGTYGAHVWRGIPYAAPPVGPLRWRAPDPPTPWQGVRKATAFGPRCPQVASRLDSTAEAGSVVGEEDCLSLNVFAPPDAAGRGLPVMVWIHGGGNIQGGSDFYDGGALAMRHDVVVVTLNYRLGPLGWLRHAALRDGVSYEEESGNFAVLDLIHALHWVSANAATFGGNPGSVTIFGESAGARDVLMLLVAPAAQGLFHGAIVESGGLRSVALAEAENRVDAPVPGDPQSSGEVLLRLRVADGAADRAAAVAQVDALIPEEIADYLRSKTPAELLAAYPPDDQEGEGTGFYSLPQMFRDGVVLPEVEPEQAYATGTYARVPVILGTNRDEAKLFMFASEKHVRRTLGIPRLRDAEAYEREAAYRSRFWKATGVDEIAAAMRRVQGPSVFAYRFDWDEQPSVFGADLGRMLGAAHALEIPFVFGHWDLGPNTDLIFDDGNAAGRVALSDAMMSYWAEFAWTGAPGRGRDGSLPPWPAWDPTRDDADKYLVLDTAQDGGIRMASETESSAALFAELAKDPGIGPAERCAILGELIRARPRAAERSGATPCAPERIAGGD
jgi:para-nitrobenzyl esterase